MKPVSGYQPSNTSTQLCFPTLGVFHLSFHFSNRRHGNSVCNRHSLSSSVSVVRAKDRSVFDQTKRCWSDRSLDGVVVLCVGLYRVEETLCVCDLPGNRGCLHAHDEEESVEKQVFQETYIEHLRFSDSSRRQALTHLSTHIHTHTHTHTQRERKTCGNLMRINIQ